MICTPGGTTHFDFNEYTSRLGSDPLFHPERQPNNSAEFDKEFQKRSEERVVPTVYLVCFPMYVSLINSLILFQLRPTAHDPSIKYAIMKPRGNIPSLHIRFWYGPFGECYGYNFDLIDPGTKAPIFAPKGLVIQYFEYGQWYELMATTESLRLSRGLPPTPDFLLPEKWQANPGTLLRFSEGLDGIVIGEVAVPNAPIGENPHYEYFSNYDDAVANSLL